ncbi:ATP-binding cassette domain-containing protein [Saccharibacillus deserti]|uniref:ATP-binding cassette domain-containing protein n=1 Tax=Saccharibacillus deserti TaxID=1634444 RepID=UPI001551C12E
MLEVKRVSKRYDGGRGVREIDFSMQRGEIVGFLGPNGAGKTTTMRMITGYLYPTEGTVTVDGLSVHEEARKARSKIGYLPETPPLYPDLTVEAYLKFVAKLRGVPAREQKLRTAEMVARLGLGGRERQSIRHLSKGYKQRLGLAQAIIHKPDLLVLDEPTSGLDPSQIIEIRSLIRELGENHTVLLSTHILQEVGALCDRLLIINRGELVMDGAPDEIGARMENRFAVTLEVYGQRERIESVLGGWAGSRGITAEIRGVPEPKGQTSEMEPLESEQSKNQQSDNERTLAGNGPDAAAASHEPLAQTEPFVETEPVAAPPQSLDLFASSSEAVRALLTADGQEDFRLELFRLLAEADLPILELHKENPTLEDVFLKLTTEDRADGLVDKDGLGTDGGVRVETGTGSGEERA